MLPNDSDAWRAAEYVRAGIPLNQWFTGYWEGFDRYGHDVYKRLYQEAA